MEKKIKLKTKDNYVIYGTLNTPKTKTDTLVVFVHGLAGHQNEHIFFNAAKFFTTKGIATFRFNLYWGEKGARVLSKTGFSDHAVDVETTFKYFRNKYNKIFVVGHSFGGISILLAKLPQTAGLVLWDAAQKYDRKDDQDDFRYVKSLGAYVMSYGIEVLFGKKMMEEWKKLPGPKGLIEDKKVPVKVIVAGKGGLIKADKEYYQNAGGPKEFASIKGATHCFDEQGTEEKLFQETLKFVKKYS